MRLSDDDILMLLQDLESERVERKESLVGSAPGKVREAICAFANDLPGYGRPGVVFIGARDDGTPSGLKITDELIRQLADMKTDGQIVPPPTMSVEKRRVAGFDMVVITVQPSDSPPVRCKGVIWVRTGSRRVMASAQDERVLNERRRHRDKPFDLRALPSATLRDLDRRRFEDEYLPAAFSAEVLAANERSLTERMAATKMVTSADEPVPTVVGVLVLSSRALDFLPGAYVQFLRIAGESLADEIVDEQRVDGPISDVARRIDDKLESHNRTSVDLTSGSVERRQQTYPMAALRQIVRNALMHRSYEATNAPIAVHWFDDRIEVISPGGPFGNVNEANLGQPGVVDYRNPNLAEAMKVLGLVQRFGVGIATARRELAQNGNPPLELAATATHVVATVRPASRGPLRSATALPDGRRPPTPAPPPPRTA